MACGTRPPRVLERKHGLAGTCGTFEEAAFVVGQEIQGFELLVGQTK